MRDERPRRRPAGQRLHHRRFDFENPFPFMNFRISSTICMRSFSVCITSGLAHRSTYRWR